VGSRVEGLVAYESEIQFAPEARRLALAARDQVVKFRKQFPSITSAARFLSTQASDTEGPWRLFHAGVALGCIGQIAPARTFFLRLMEREPTSSWQQALHEKAREMAELLTDQPAFQTRINIAVRITRERLKLPEYSAMRIT
jgi:hypothetical protein